MKIKNSQNQILNRYWLQISPFGAPFSPPKRSKMSFGTLSKKISNSGTHFFNFSQFFPNCLLVQVFAWLGSSASSS